MSFGYTGPLQVSEKDLATIGRFIHRCGLLESAIDSFIRHYNLEQEVEQLNKKKRKSLDDKVRVLSRYCHHVREGELSEKKLRRAKSIQRNLQQYKRKNGVRDLRNTIAHNPVLVSVMGAWQPGPGYIKRYHNEVKTGSGEIVEVLTTWRFSEIEILSEELLAMMIDMGFQPKDQL